ncbi:MAG: hypothetical protein IPF98_11365 [Gemmatimonadetes bacterium]|jgi:hypothetical protein|nr:hypothetical protein [Gemmatimonadota bacterium]MCC6771688.1 hypothetical protein [Gemmatimonadaceae bacterium]
MFGSIRSREHDALAPLISLARGQGAAQRQAWLDDLRTEAPTVVARVEQALAEADRRHQSSEASADARGADLAPTAVPAEVPAEVPTARRPFWTMVVPQRASVPDRARGDLSAITPRSPERYSAPSLAVGGLRRRAGEG